MSFAMRILIAVLILILSLSSLSVLAQSRAESEAEGVLLRYFDALSQGDVRTLRGLIDGEMRESQGGLLENPTWPAWLVQTFGGADLSVDRIETLGPDEVLIEASIIYGADDSTQRRYLLRRAPSGDEPGAPFRIHDETGPELQ